MSTRFFGDIRSAFDLALYVAVLRHIVRILSRVTFHSEREPDDREPRDRGAARARARRQHDQEARPRLPGHHESRARGITRETRRVRVEYEFSSAIGAREIERRAACAPSMNFHPRLERARSRSETRADPRLDRRETRADPRLGETRNARARRGRSATVMENGRAQRDAAEPTRAPTRHDTERSPLLQASTGSAPRRFAPPFRAASLHRSARGRRHRFDTASVAPTTSTVSTTTRRWSTRGRARCVCARCASRAVAVAVTVAAGGWDWD